MKKTVFLVSIMFCLCMLYWHVSFNRNMSNLYNIETRFHRAPFEAWKQLRQINPGKLNRKELALYSLLLTKGKMMRDSLSSSDSLINRTIEYYEEVNDSSRLSQAYYYKGNICRQKQCFIEATECYQKAEDYATDENVETKYLLNRIMGKIYHFKSMHEDEKEAKKEAVHYAVLLKNPLSTGESHIEMAKYYNTTGNFECGINSLKQAIQILPDSSDEELASANAELSKSYLASHRADSSLYYINCAVQKEKDSANLYDYYNLKASAFFKLAQNDSAEYYFRHSLESNSLRTKATALYNLFLLNERYGDKDEELKCLKAHIQYRDSLDLKRKEGVIDHLQNIQAYKRQKENARHAELQLANSKVVFYRTITITFIIILILVFLFFKNQKRKRILEMNITMEEEKNVRLMLGQKEAENKLLREQEERKKEEIRCLNLTIEYYKRLNAITVPILFKSQNNQGAMHLKEEEWGMIVENTNACFDEFTFRLKNRFPQLTKEEVQLCCLIKMELSISLLSEIYHIAKTSISRKKVRLKEKMGVEEVTIDEFIRSF